MENQRRITMLLAVLAVQSAVVISCNFPPEFWCSSEEIAKECNVVKQCADWSAPNSEAPKVNFTLYYESYCGDCQVFITAGLNEAYMAVSDIMNLTMVPYGNAMVVKQCAEWSALIDDTPKVNFTLYYESYCPDCQVFFRGQLHDAYTAVSDIMNLTLVPYGNAMETKEGSEYKFQCQHGAIECQGNILETCILHYVPFQTAYKTIYCMEFSQSPVFNAKKCMEKNGVNYEQVFTCANGSLGNALEHQMALKTEALKPQHQYVPWVTLNGVHTEQIQNEAQNDLKKLICDTYKGTKPPACSQEEPRIRSCIRE